MIWVPELSDIDFKRIEQKINSEFEAVEIYTEIDKSKKELDCFSIVKEKVEKNGGQLILGWQIWKSKILIEAEAHAVWEDEDLELHDISPKANFTPEKILFIEDNRFSYEGKQIDNIRMNITKNKLVDHYIEISKLFFHFRNKGKRAECHDLSKILNESEINEIGTIYDWKNNLEIFIYQGNTEESLCYCGGSRRYKNCHGEDFYKQIKRMKK